MQRNRDDLFAGEPAELKAFLQRVSERFCQGYSVAILQMMDDFAQRVREEQGRPGEVKDSLALDAVAAEPFNCRSRFAALPAERRIDRNQAGPAFRACRSVPSLQNLGAADDARDGK